jgi:histone-arginine methyltransferase CARM1
VTLFGAADVLCHRRRRMLESYIIARKLFLRPGGRMFPATGTIYAAPFTDAGTSTVARRRRRVKTQSAGRGQAAWAASCSGARGRRPAALSFPLPCPRPPAALWSEQAAKAAFWQSADFYGLDLRSLADAAAADHFSQPVVG